MILVTLGTQDKEFTRLLKVIDKEIENKNINDKVIVQAGFTKYESNNMEIFDLIPGDELDKLVKECDILITHGGVGSILSGLKNNKKIIAAARLSKYGEHTNDHQIQIIKEFVDRGYILELDDFNKLGDIIKNINSFKPNKFKSNNKIFTKNIENYIENDKHTSWYNKYRYLFSNGYRGVLLSAINLFIFNIFSNRVQIINNILVSYFLTLIIGLIFGLFMDIKYNKKNYLVSNIISVLIQGLLLSMFINIFNLNILMSIIISLILVLIISYTFLRNDR